METTDNIPSASNILAFKSAGLQNRPADTGNGAHSHPRPLSDYIALGCLILLRDAAWSKLPHRNNGQAWHSIDLDHHRGGYVNPGPVDAAISLIAAGWLRAYTGATNERTFETWRIYLLADDVARASIDGRSKKHAKLLQAILPLLDTSLVAWQGSSKAPGPRAPSFDAWATSEHTSLFYLFNTLPSPAPQPECIPNTHLRNAVERLLEHDQLPWGLRTSLYPYQRRCAAAMIQKENVQTRQLDPRLECRQSPTGEQYYYAPRDGLFLKSPQYYESCQGGILAETMGLGKTLICIAVITLTRGQYPAVPIEYDVKLPRGPIRSLSDMAAATVIKTGLPWKTFFDDHQDATRNDLTQCKAIMARQTPMYEIPPKVIRSMRRADIRGPSERVRLCHGTIVVVPPNLLHQWQAELTKHVQDGALSVLVMKDPKVDIPPPEELAEYDVVLFSRRRFEKENSTWLDVEYESPLRKLHWLRIIIDEGHGFSSSSTNAALVAEKLVKAERRWIVTGTPARDLLGVEVDISAMTACDSDGDFDSFKEASLEQRKAYDETQERSTGAVKSIGALASKYLRAKPWCLPSTSEGGANWDEYIYRHQDFYKRTYDAFSQCLRTTLTDLMIKTRPEDVEGDIQLPPLRHEIIRLRPSLIDKMTANLFVLLYTTNAVTSERRDQDYLFHASSRSHLQQLTTNLRRSAFSWTGFKEKDVVSSLETGRKYLSKQDTGCVVEDRDLLNDTMASAQLLLASPMWRGLATSSEMGIFVEDWPTGNETVWAYDGCVRPPMLGLTQAIEAQKFINDQIAQDNPLEGFEDAGELAMLKTHEEDLAIAEGTLVKEDDMQGLKANKAGVPSSGYGSGMGSKRVSGTGTSRALPKKNKRRMSLQESNEPSSPSFSKTSPRKKRKLSSGGSALDLTSLDALGRSRAIGTTSSKLSYLIDRVSALHKDEKILIFYDANHIAFYISQMLDLLNIKHLIYANTLSSEQRSKYVVLFNEDPSHRVLVMDLKQAAHGLNLSSASRVFFVNPPWRPDVEAQAIKRAHRIGQMRPVHVETLVLKDTVEEAMFERAAKMTRREHLAVKTLEEDEDMRTIIQNARVLPVSESELQGTNQMAPLQSPQQLFGRPGRAAKAKTGKMEEDVFGHGEGDTAQKVKPKKQPKGKSKEVEQEEQQPYRTDTGIKPHSSALHSQSPTPTTDLRRPINHAAENGGPSSSAAAPSLFGG